MNRVLFILVIGLGGAAILISLGIWQVQRLAWKEGVIADAEWRLAAEPYNYNERVNFLQETRGSHPMYVENMPAKITGSLGEKYLRVLVSKKVEGAGYRIITTIVPSFTGTEHGNQSGMLVDLGFLPVQKAGLTLPKHEVTIVANPRRPQEVDRFTPEPDIENNIWFARDVEAMAKALRVPNGDIAKLYVVRSISPLIGNLTPLPANAADIPNNHLQYAITWFSLAAIWLAMSVYFLRTRAKS